MPIVQDHYFDPTLVGSNLAARGYGNLAGADVFFYVSGTNELRAKQANAASTQGQATVQILVTGVKWLAVIQQPPQGIVHLYYSLFDGTMHYAPYTAANFSEPVVPQNLNFSTQFTFSATYAPNGTPPAYVLVIDDGTRHTVYTSATPNFASLLGQAQVYNNNVDHTHYASMPTIALHPDDTNAATIHVQLATLQPPGPNEVGFYAVKLPGVG